MLSDYTANERYWQWRVSVMGEFRHPAKYATTRYIASDDNNQIQAWANFGFGPHTKLALNLKGQGYNQKWNGIQLEVKLQHYWKTGAMITNSWSHRRLPMITAASPLVGVISDVIWPHLAMITAAVIAAAGQLWPLTITPITDPNHNPKP